METIHEDNWANNNEKLQHFYSLHSLKCKQLVHEIKRGSNIHSHGIMHYTYILIDETDKTSDYYMETKKKMDLLYNKRYQILKKIELLTFELNIYDVCSDFYKDKTEYHDRLECNRRITTKNSPVKKITITKKNNWNSIYARFV
jgi:hypothetical protein